MEEYRWASAPFLGPQMPVSCLEYTVPNTAVERSNSDVAWALSKVVGEMVFKCLMPSHMGRQRIGLVLQSHGAQDSQVGPAQFLHTHRRKLMRHIQDKFKQKPETTWENLLADLCEKMLIGRLSVGMAVA